MCYFNGPWRSFLSNNFFTVFFGVTRTQMEHISEEIVWLPFFHRWFISDPYYLLIFTLRQKESLEVIPFQYIKLLCVHMNELPFDMSNYKFCIWMSIRNIIFCLENTPSQTYTNIKIVIWAFLKLLVIICFCLFSMNS